ncbi:MAG: MFS transporter [candidate division NC10 bacterium]|nr:MFS transporter [candidate division NC10 bacterium]
MKPSGSHSLHDAFRKANAATFLFSTSGAFFLLLPVYLQQSGSSPAQIGLVAGLLRASSLLARPLAGRLLDRFGRRPVTAAGAGLAIVGVLSLFVFPRVGIPFLTMRILQGIGTSLVDSGLGATVADLSPPAARARVFSIYTAWMNLASALMPGAGEAIARHGGFFALRSAQRIRSGGQDCGSARAGGDVLLLVLCGTDWRAAREWSRPRVVDASEGSASRLRPDGRRSGRPAAG